MEGSKKGFGDVLIFLMDSEEMLKTPVVQKTGFLTSYSVETWSQHKTFLFLGCGSPWYI